MQLNDVIQFIYQADDLEVNAIIDALSQRYKVVYPDWEVAFMALPLNDQSRRNTILDLLKRTK